MSPNRVDDTDLEIIDLLIENGRISAAEIASRIGNVTERTVRNRLNSLFKRELIHIGAMPDPITRGLHVIADVAIQVEPGKVFEVARLLADYENINYVACTTGETDIAIEVGAKTVIELYTFVADTIGNMPGVRKTMTNVIPLILKTIGYKTKAFFELEEELNQLKRKP